MSVTRERLERLRVLLFDVDGILTDNGLYVGEDGNVSKRFNILDGAGIKFAQMAGLATGLISGHQSEATRKRAAQLGMTVCHVGVKDKIPVFDAVLAELGLEPDQALYMGDDLMDMPLLRRAGIAVTVPEADPLVLEICDHVTRRAGGQGAVREMVEWVLRGLGRWDEIVARYA
ncbi:MAG: HAD hydrolase family protein [Planctomycetes bacterium]|nr:HAD hydrolase family protein [Planctomycetota bacterium]